MTRTAQNCSTARGELSACRLRGESAACDLTLLVLSNLLFLHLTALAERDPHGTKLLHCLRGAVGLPTEGREAACDLSLLVLSNLLFLHLTALAERDPHGTTTPCCVRPFTARVVEFAESKFPNLYPACLIFLSRC